MNTQDRALGALFGLALGDALGMPTQSMSAEWIAASYGGPIDDLVDAVADQPIAPNMPAGSVTDDTEQALLVARLIVEGNGHIDPLQLAHELLDWEDDMRARGSHDLLGPSTKLALEQVRSGADIMTTGRTGTTNGAAMRVTPVGIAHAVDDPEFTEYVLESCRVTHNTVNGFQGAALVAAAVSHGVDGMSVHDALTRAIDDVAAMPTVGAWSAKANVLARTRMALDLAGTERDDDVFAERLRSENGTSVEANESVPAAFALAWRYADDPLCALCTAASNGGDTDTIGAMAGAMLGAALGPSAYPVAMVTKVVGVSRLRLVDISVELAAVRETRS